VEPAPFLTNFQSVSILACDPSHCDNCEEKQKMSKRAAKRKIGTAF
jgi:hypothetical protein